MIRTLTIKNFKKFRELSLPLRKLTVLTGRNGGGKSTVLQALLLVRQSARVSQANESIVALNDIDGLELGEAAEILSTSAAEPEISLGAEVADGATAVWILNAGADRQQYLTIERMQGLAGSQLALVGRLFTYLSAERLGPRDSQSTFPRGPAEMVVGAQGEYLAHFLAQFERVEVQAEIRHPEAKGETTTLLRQTEYWMADVLSPIEIEAQWLPGSNIANIRFKTPGVRTDWRRPTNFGFGFSYCLPIIVSGLSTPPGGILVVENPEAHLHPRSQSRLARFLALVAAGGVQVVIETHSDHVVNGIRRAALDQSAPSRDEIAVHFFGETERPLTLELTAKGSLTAWPKGFFDQMELDLAEIARPRSE